MNYAEDVNHVELPGAGLSECSWHAADRYGVQTMCNSNIRPQPQRASFDYIQTNAAQFVPDPVV
jgi:hypothetical protein